MGWPLLAGWGGTGIMGGCSVSGFAIVWRSGHSWVGRWVGGMATTE